MKSWQHQQRALVVWRTKEVKFLHVKSSCSVVLLYLKQKSLSYTVCAKPSGSKKSNSKLPPSKGEDMEIDLACSLPSGKGPSSPPPGIRKTPEDSEAEARSSSGAPRSLETTRSSESSSRHVLESSPFAFLIRSSAYRSLPRFGRRY